MAVPILTIVLPEVKEFYPVTDSLSQSKIDDVMRHVKNVIFLQMFGFAITEKIFSGDIADSAADEFMGFRKFVALNIAAYFAGEVFTHTNAGLKAINQSNWQTATKSDSSTTVMPLSDAVTAQFIQAQKILKASEQYPNNNYVPYSGIEIDVL